MKSFAILRTNVGLTTNAKIVVADNYGLSIDSIESSYELSADRFKNFKFNENVDLCELLPKYYKDVPVDISYFIKYDNDNYLMSDNFENQYQELYNYGARNIIDNKNYDEEYEYFAPIYVNKDAIPNNFIIFRVDGSGIDIINSGNFKQKIVKNFKVVKVYDLVNSPLGKWLDRNFRDNIYFPHSPLDISFRKSQFSKWYGIDYKNGGYISKSKLLDSILEDEQEIFEFEKFIFNSYKESAIIFPNILNFSFLFNDAPSTPEIHRKWSLNRYYGFYVDEMELITTMSPYNPPTLRDDVVILDGNILHSPSNPNNPFVQGWDDFKPYYIEYNGEYYIVEKFIGQTVIDITNVNYDDYINEEFESINVIQYKIICDSDITGQQSHLNQNYGIIIDNMLMKNNTDPYIIVDFDSADVWLIQIDGIYHNIIKNTEGKLVIVSDYSFDFKLNTYEYTISSTTKSVNFMVDYDNLPKKFNIYRLNFSDIHDFDTRIIDTEYSKFEYEKSDDITYTDESKMYFKNYNSNSIPKDIDDFIFKNKVVNIPVSSEYTANYETFKVIDNKLSDIWRINPVYCRWGFQNSISANDMPYLLNNSQIFEEYNRTTNPFDVNPIREERNLDYFYTINSSTTSYLHHTLHVEELNNPDFKFDIDKYFNITYDYDYFTYFFDRNMTFDNSLLKKNVRKYSYFNKGDNAVPNITLFRGLKFKLYDVDSIKLNSNKIDSINVSQKNNFDDYKFSIILTGGYNSCVYYNYNAVATCSVVDIDTIWSQAYNDCANYTQAMFQADPEDCTIDTNWTFNITIDDEEQYSGESFFSGNLIVVPTIEDIQNEANSAFSSINLVLEFNEEYATITQVSTDTDPATFIGDEIETSVCINFQIGYVDKDRSYLVNYQTCITLCQKTFEMERQENDIIVSSWQNINNWALSKQFYIGDVIIHNFILYTCLVDIQDNNPTYTIGGIQVPAGPHTNSNYTLYDNEIFWVPNKTYGDGDIIYYNNCYYFCISSSSLIDIWNPYTSVTTGYSIDHIVLYKGKYYKSIINNNYYVPDIETKRTKIREFQKIDNYSYWEPIELQSTAKWQPIQLWDSNESYDTNTIVYHAEIVYKSNSETEIGDEPGMSILWDVLHTFNPEIELDVYNRIVKFNGLLYILNI